MGIDSKPIRSTDESVDLFVGSAKVGAFAGDQTRIGGKTLKLDANSPADLYIGDWMGNPATTYVPSNIVTPEISWLPLPPGLSAIASILWGIKDILAAMEESTSSQGTSRNGKIKGAKTQVINYDQLLPENV